MQQMSGNEERVLAAARELVRTADASREYAQAVAEFISATSLLPVAKLQSWESLFRQVISLESGAKPKFFRTRAVIPLQFSWLDYCHWDGYQRERALRTSCGGAPNGFLFALVLRRLNDWVPQVCAAARAYVPKIAANTAPEHILEALWITLPHLQSWGRLQTEDLEVLLTLLSIEGVPLQLASKLMSVTAGPAAVILGQAGRTPVLDQCLSAIAQRAVQPAVRAKAYRSQLEQRMIWLEGRKWVWTDSRSCQGRYEPVLGERKIRVCYSFLETLAKAAKDKSAMVRRVAGDVLLAQSQSLGAEAIPIAETLASDTYPSVAERGEFALKNLAASRSTR